jgi:hypothetical protein
MLVAFSQGCGPEDKSREGPPFEPENIEGQESLVITNSDIEGVGVSTPYGAILRWWQALQLGDVEGVKRSYAGGISSRNAAREIYAFQPRFSQPIDPEVQTQGNLATVDIVVRAANLADTPGVVAITDFPARFYLVRTAAGWRLRLDSYRRYVRARRATHLAGVG